MKFLSVGIGALLLLSLSGCLTLEQGAKYVEESLTGDVQGTQLADALYNKGDFSTASKIYHRLLEKNPRDIHLWRRYSSILYEIQAYPEALQSYETLIELEPDLCDGYVGAGKSSLKLARPIRASEYFRQCYRLDENHRQALIGLAISEDLAGNALEASLFYKAAIGLSPFNLNLKNNFALSLILADKIDEAIEILNHVAFGPTASSQVRQNLALAYGLKGDEVAAAQVAALDLSPRAVQNNLRYYAFIRHMSDKEALRGLLLAQTGPTQ